MLRVGLTGGIGSGKSTASRMFAKLGAHIFDADAEAKRILNENQDVQKELISEFGTDILGPSEEISREKLARIAFQDEDHQLRLNAIVHPYVSDAYDGEFERLAAKGKTPIFILDAPLVYEAGLDQHMDYVIVIASTVKLRIERSMKRGTLSREQILRRMDLQWTDEEKSGLADFIIRNNGTEEELKEQIENIFNQLV